MAWYIRSALLVQTNRLYLRRRNLIRLNDSFKIAGDPATTLIYRTATYPGIDHKMVAWILKPANHYIIVLETGQFRFFTNWKIIGFWRAVNSKYDSTVISNLGYRLSTELEGQPWCTIYAINLDLMLLNLKFLAVFRESSASQKVTEVARNKICQRDSDVKDAPGPSVFNISGWWLRKFEVTHLFKIPSGPLEDNILI